MFLRHCERPSFTPIQNKRQNYEHLWEVHKVNSYSCTKHPATTSGKMWCSLVSPAACVNS